VIYNTYTFTETHASWIQYSHLDDDDHDDKDGPFIYCSACNTMHRERLPLLKLCSAAFPCNATLLSTYLVQTTV